MLTEFFGEYIRSNAGGFPSAFDKIPALDGIPFKDLFYEHFCDREIGFETEALFAIKFNARADLVCPIYVQKIEDLNKINFVDGSTRKITNSAKGVDKTTVTENGETENAVNRFGNTINPTAAEVETPAPGALEGQDRSKAAIKNHTTVTEIEPTATRETLESGLTVDEAIRVESQIFELHNVYNDLLKEFEPLFLGVWVA